MPVTDDMDDMDDMDEIDTIEEVTAVEEAGYALQLTGLVAHDGLVTDTLGTLDITIANLGTDTSLATQVSLSFRSDSSVSAAGRVAIPRIPPGARITVHAQVPKADAGLECYTARVEIPDVPDR